MTHDDSQVPGARLLQKGTQGANSMYLRCQKEPEFPSREYRFILFGEKLKQVLLTGCLFCFNTQSLTFYLFLDVRLFFYM